jgi:hypothetical protein
MTFFMNLLHGQVWLRSTSAKVRQYIRSFDFVYNSGRPGRFARSEAATGSLGGDEMRDLKSGTWKRLTFALALAAVVFTGLIAPATPGNAIPPPPNCGSNQSTIITYYSSSTYQNALCSDILYPCPGYSRTYYCRGSETPYTKMTCNSCPLN